MVSPIITQIGRENNISAEIYVSWTVEDACPYNFGLSKHPYENQPKGVALLRFMVYTTAKYFCRLMYSCSSINDSMPAYARISLMVISGFSST